MTTHGEQPIGDEAARLEGVEVVIGKIMADQKVRNIRSEGRG